MIRIQSIKLVTNFSIKHFFYVKTHVSASLYQTLWCTYIDNSLHLVMPNTS